MLHALKLAAQKLAKEKGGCMGNNGLRGFEVAGFEELLGMGDVGGVVRGARYGRVGQMGR